MNSYEPISTDKMQLGMMWHGTALAQQALLNTDTGFVKFYEFRIFSYLHSLPDAQHLTAMNWWLLSATNSGSTMELGVEMVTIQ